VLEDSEYLAEITRNKPVLRKPFSPKQLIDFIDSSFCWDLRLKYAAI
jgi:hypothetical protein